MSQPNCTHACPLFNTELAGQILQDIGSVKTTVESLHRSVEGNGKPGLRDRIEALEKWRSLLVGAWLTLSIAGYLLWDYVKARFLKV